MEVSRCSRRHLEAGGNSKEGEGGNGLFHSFVVWRRHLRGFLWIFASATPIYVKFSKLTNKKNLLVSKYLYFLLRLNQGCCQKVLDLVVDYRHSILVLSWVYFHQGTSKPLQTPPCCECVCVCVTVCINHWSVCWCWSFTVLFMLLGSCALCKKQTNQASKPLFIQHFVPDWWHKILKYCQSYVDSLSEANQLQMHLMNQTCV